MLFITPALAKSTSGWFLQNPCCAALASHSGHWSSLIVTVQTRLKEY